MKARLRDERFSFPSLFQSLTQLIPKVGIGFIWLLFLIPHSAFCQQNISSNQISPELQNQVFATLRESSKKFQLISNDGQMNLPKNVIAYFSTNSQTVFVEKDRLRIIILDPVSGNKSSKAKQKYRYNSFNIRFIDCKRISDVEKGKPFTTRRNFIGAHSQQHNIIDVSSYDEITLKNIYEGIDLRLYSQNEGQLEFDWVIWPGADPEMIKMKFEGQKKLFISKEGQLQVGLPMGDFFMHMPESFYVTPNGKKIADCHFSLTSKNIVRFKLNKARDARYPLIIDPNLLWGTFFDGGNASFDEYLYGIEYDYSSQLIYCAGAANLQVSTSYAAALSSTYDGTFSSGKDAFIYALTKNGQTIQYITYLGGSGNDVAVGVSVGGTKIFICGYTTSSDFPTTSGGLGGGTAAFDNSLGGTQDGFVAVFNTSLNSLSYCTYLGGTGNSDRALTIRATSSTTFYVSLDVYASLPTSSPNYLVNYADNSFGGTEDAWIGKFTSLNTLSFGTYVGGTSTDVINDFQILSDGDIVFTGTTEQITEVNDHVTDHSGYDALFGRIEVPLSGSVSFSIIEKFGGTGDDKGYGICILGDSISTIVGETQSSNFPLGSGTNFQGSSGGGTDAFIAKIRNDGTGGYKACYTGGSGTDILVSIRLIIINSQAVLLSFGSTNSSNLAVTNFNAESFYSGSLTGGKDMMFLICDFNFVNKYYLSYIGGTGNDYLGATGVAVGSNHLFYNTVDSVLYVGTTTHSYDSTQNPKFVGRGIADVANAYVPVFDQVKNNGTNDTHVIIAIATNTIYTILAINWINFETNLDANCGVDISWATAQPNEISRYIIERSFDGFNYKEIAQRPGGISQYYFTDPSVAHSSGNAFYRIRSIDIKGYSSYSKINIVRLCRAQEPIIKVYPTITNDHITIDVSQITSTKEAVFRLYNSAGEIVMKKQLLLNNGSLQLSLNASLSSGPHFLLINDAATAALLHQEKIIISRN